LIAEASSLVALACNREGFGRARYRETFHHGPSTSWHRRGVVLSEDINVKVESVAVDGVTVDPAGYRYDGVLLRRICGNASTILIGPYGWTCRSLEVVYWAGWDALASVPPAVERVVLNTVGSLYSAPVGRDASVRSEQIEGVGTITYGTQAQSGPVVTLERYPELETYARVIQF
jgi:hypothetical protein